MTFPQLSEPMLRRLPAILEASRVAVEESTARRRELIRAVQSAQHRFASEDAALVAEAEPLEQKLAALQAEVERLQKDVAPQQAARRSLESSLYLSLYDLHAQLRAVAQPDLIAFQNDLDVVRNEISNNVSGRRAHILRDFKPELPMQQRILEAMRLTLDACREAQRGAVEVEDFNATLDRLRQQIRAAGIELTEQ